MRTRMTIQAWYRIFAADPFAGNHNAPRSIGHEMPFGVKYWGPTLEENDGTMLAEFLRGGDDPLVRQVLPNPATMKRWKMIREIVLDEGGETITVPRRTLEAASIIFKSIEVIDTVPSKNPLRAAEQLIRADVRVEQDWWSSTRFGRQAQKPPRQAYFLSGFDANERGLSYFFCELPQLQTPPTTVGGAYEALKPQSVKHAEKLRRKVKRQGDMFFIRMPRAWQPPDGIEHSGIEVMRGGRKTWNGKAALHNSNHAAEDVVRIDGLTYASGTVHHVPDFRRPDHRPLRLGRRWWLCVRNTVPVVGRG